MNSLLYYYNNVQKMAAYRQAKRMQLGALTAQGGFSTNNRALLQVPCTIQCVFVPRTFESRQCVFDTNGSNLSPRIDILDTGNIIFYLGGTSKSFAGEVGRQYNVTFVVSETERSVYVGGELLGSTSYERTSLYYYVIGGLTGNFKNRFQGDYLLHRHFNYAMSADEVKALDNNGDPMGYVVPKAMRGEIFSYLSDFSSGTDGWKPASGNELSVEDGALLLTGPASPLYMTNSMSNNDRRPHIYSVELVVDTNPDISRVTCFAFQGSSPGKVNNGIDNGDGTTTYSIISPSELSTYTSTFQFGFDMTNVSPVKIRSIKLKTALCLAEYLPQNLMGSRKGPEVDPLAETFEMNMGDVNYKRVIAIDYPPYSSVYRVDYVIDEWDCTPAPIDYVGFGFSFSAKDLGGAYKWQTLEAAKIGEVQSFIFSAPSGNRPEVGLYAALDEEGAITRHLKVTIKGITPVSVPISWLDSAKQLPLSDEYMEPLFQSIGGYDMAANGAPEILYNE